MNPARSPRSGRSSLDLYLDAMGTHARLDADDEREHARRVVERRRTYWRALLSCPTRLLDVLERVAASCEEATLSEAMDATGQALRRFVDDPTDEAAARLAVRCEALADALTAAGVDPTVVDPTNGKKDPDERFARRVRRARVAFHDARDRFVCANLRLVVALANRYGRHHMSLADRVQEGNLGLLKAVDRFDPDRGVRFSTYAAWWIRHAITRALTNHGRVVRVPAHVQALFTKMRGARAQLRSSLGREATDEELAEAIGVTASKLRWVRDAMQMRAVGLDAPVAPSAEVSAHDALADEDAPDIGASLDACRNHTLATLAFRSLEAKERDILQRRFGLADADPVTLQSLGDRYGVSRERVRQLQNRALAKLREVVESSPTRSCTFAVA